MPSEDKTIPTPAKCACPSCHCQVQPGNSVLRDGKIFCSRACAYDCTDTTCVCVHDRCELDDSVPGHVHG